MLLFSRPFNNFLDLEEGNLLVFLCRLNDGHDVTVHTAVFSETCAMPERKQAEPRRRGRPPKNNSDPIQKEPRRQGRKLGGKNKPKKEVTVPLSKRGRGRPRKTQQDTVTVKRGPGSPKGSKNKPKVT